LIGRNFLVLQRLHLIFPSMIFEGFALIFALQRLQMNTFLKSLPCAAGILAILVDYDVNVL